MRVINVTKSDLRSFRPIILLEMMLN